MPFLLSLIHSSFWFQVRNLSLFLSLEHWRGPCQVINWPNLNIVVSQGIGKALRGTVGEAVRTHTFINEVWGLIQVQFVVLWTNNSSNLKDHWLHISVTNIIIMKLVDILCELLRCDAETKCKQMLLAKQCWWTCSRYRFATKPSIYKKKCKICEAQ